MGVVDVSTLGAHQAEVFGGPGDGLGRIGGAEGPRGPRGARERHVDRGRRGLVTADPVRPLARDESEVGDVAEPIGRDEPLTERVRDIGAVRPGLHQPGREERPRAHRSSVPVDPGSFVHGRARPVERRPIGSPAFEHLRGRHRSVLLERDVVEARVFTAHEQLFDAVQIARRVDDRLGRRGVEVGEVSDLVRDIPPRTRCRCSPSFMVQRGDERVEGLLFVDEVVSDLAEFAHDSSTRATGTSTTRLRSHSPRPFAWASWRLDAATPSSSSPCTTKLSDRSAGNR